MNKVKKCRYGDMVYQPNDLYIGRSLDLYGEFSEAEVRLFRSLVSAGRRRAGRGGERRRPHGRPGPAGGAERRGDRLRAAAARLLLPVRQRGAEQPPPGRLLPGRGRRGRANAPRPGPRPGSGAEFRRPRAGRAGRGSGRPAGPGAAHRRPGPLRLPPHQDRRRGDGAGSPGRGGRDHPPLPALPLRGGRPPRPFGRAAGLPARAGLRSASSSAALLQPGERRRPSRKRLRRHGFSESLRPAPRGRAAYRPGCVRHGPAGRGGERPA